MDRRDFDSAGPDTANVPDPDGSRVILGWNALDGATRSISAGGTQISIANPVKRVGYRPTDLEVTFCHLPAGMARRHVAMLRCGPLLERATIGDILTKGVDRAPSLPIPPPWGFRVKAVRQIGLS